MSDYSSPRPSHLSSRNQIENILSSFVTLLFLERDPPTILIFLEKSSLIFQLLVFTKQDKKIPPIILSGSLESRSHFSCPLTFLSASPWFTKEKFRENQEPLEKVPELPLNVLLVQMHNPKLPTDRYIPQYQEEEDQLELLGLVDQ